MGRDYWKDCIAEAFEDAGIVANQEQIDTVTSWVEGAHDNYGMSHGHDCIPNPLVEENKKLSSLLDKERRKTVCRECNGHGSISSTFGSSGRSSTSQCWVCRGEGKVS